jgi:tetratricopeptide (TPR) repeat protein
MSSSAVGAAIEEVEAEKEAEVMVCANCGIAQVDDIKLEMLCDGCQSVRYCSDICQENHREQHEEECKQRKAELHDKELFEQPEESCYGECPLCFFPLSLDEDKSSLSSCCCKLMCKGCEYAHHIQYGSDTCPFCREPAVNGEEENRKRLMERVKVNDPNALQQMGGRHYFEGDYETAFEYLKKAAELGDAAAHHNLGNMYRNGEGVEKDEEKAIHHHEKAAIGGDPEARHNLATIEEERNGNVGRAVKHLIIAANLGYEESMKMLWKHYSAGNITKEDLEATLRSHKAAIDATKSAQRDEGEAFHQQLAASRR